MKKKLIYIGIFASLLVSCTESLEDKAAREAKEYTEKYCPTPYVNDARTDSAAFDKTKKMYTYYISLRNEQRSKNTDVNQLFLHDFSIFYLKISIIFNILCKDTKKNTIFAL